MKKLGKRKWILLLLVPAVLLAVSAVVLSLPPFGGTLSGERLKRAEANPHYRDGAFVNVKPQAPFRFRDLPGQLREQFFGDEVRVPPGRIPLVPVSPASLDLLPDPTLRAFWIGHSSVYIEIDGIRMLTDPIFSEHASPFEIGPRRFHPPPLALRDLPKIDAVVISHDHYDHLDMRTIQQLARKGTRFFVPLGIGAHLEEWGVPAAQIAEREWWQEQTMGDVRIVCTPSRHYSGRGLTDYAATLWSSWSVIGPRHRFFYSGDTGYSEHFQEIGERFGPFDVSFIKIGAYGPGAPWLDVHMDPEHAIRAHQDLRAKRMFPVHWGTFNLAFHDWEEPIERALRAAGKARVDLVTPRVGEMVFADRAFSSRSWWQEVR